MVGGRAPKSEGWLVMEMGALQKHKKCGKSHTLAARRNNFSSVALTFLICFQYLVFSMRFKIPLTTIFINVSEESSMSLKQSPI